jgi:hypothetical protein
LASALGANSKNSAVALLWLLCWAVAMPIHFSCREVEMLLIVAARKKPTSGFISEFAQNVGAEAVLASAAALECRLAGVTAGSLLLPLPVAVCHRILRFIKVTEFGRGQHRAVKCIVTLSLGGRPQVRSLLTDFWCSAQLRPTLKLGARGEHRRLRGVNCGCIPAVVGHKPVRRLRRHGDDRRQCGDTHALL